MWPYPQNRNRNPLAIPAGAKKHFIQVQQEGNTVDAAGGQSSTGWTTVLSCMAAITTLAQKEAYQSGQYSAQVTHRISFDWPGPSIVLIGGMQVLFGSRTFIVQVPDNVQEMNRTVHLMCLEINGSQ